MQTGPSSSASAPLAGWWVRFFALFLDGLIIGIPGAIIIGLLAAVAGRSSGGGGIVLLLYAIWIVAYVAYFVYFWSKDGQTIGNRALHIRVVKEDGSPLTVGGGIVRYVGYIVDTIIFGLPIGYIWAAFDSKKQAWHDKIAGTIVVKTS